MNNKEQTMFYWIGWQGVAAFCWFMWGTSTLMSYWAFTALAPNIPMWVKIVSIGVSIGINFVEFMFNRMGIDELLEIHNVSDVILRLFGVVAYVYDIYTNVIAMIAVVSVAANLVGASMHNTTTLTILAGTLGALIAVGPEPLYLKFLEEKFPFPGIKYAPKYKGATVTGSTRPTGVTPAVEQYLAKKAAEARAQR